MMKQACRTFAVLATTLLFRGTPAHALDPTRPLTQYMVDFWKQSSGLPNEFIFTVHQARTGYLWLGTRGGVARFDGVRFLTYDDRKPNQLPEPEVWAIAEADDGSLWLGNYGGGLSRLKDGLFTNFTAKDGLPSDTVRSLAFGPDRSLWIATLVGLGRLKDGRFTTYRAEDGLPSSRILEVFVDPEGIVWIGTERGLASYREGRFEDYTARHPELDGPVASIAGSGRDGLWLGYFLQNQGEGLRSLKDGMVRSFSTRDGLPSDAVMSIAVDTHGAVWIGTLDGLCRYREGRFERLFSEAASQAERVIETVSLRGIESLAFDREGSLWMGTRFDGLARLRDTSFQNVTGGETSGRAIDVRSILQDRQGTVWLGKADGLARLNGGAAAAFYPLPNSDALAEDHDGNIWIGTARGLFRLPRGGKPERFAPLGGTVIQAVFVDDAGALWIGSRADGLYRWAEGALTRLTTKEGLIGDQIRGIGQDRRGGIWVAARDGGLSCVREGRITNLGPNEGLASATAQAVYVDSDGTVWAATRRGLSRVKDGKVATLTTERGLPANFFYQILEDDLGFFWLTHGAGVARVSKQELNDAANGTLKTISAVTFGTEAGLRTPNMAVANQPSVCKTRDGRLWFGTARGAAVIDPRNLAGNRVPPPVWIEEVKVDGAAAAPEARTVWPPGRGDVEIHYTALSLLDPSRVRFRYRLDGLDDDWVAAGTRRSAYYTHLPPGRYRFRVLACNNDGVWNEEGASLTLELTPHWYQTRWFVAGATLALTALLAAAYRYRLRQHQRREADLQQRVEERTSDLQREVGERVRLNEDLNRRAAEVAAANRDLEAFAYSVSHDLRAPLRAIDGFSRILAEEAGDTLDEDGRRLVGLVRASTNNMARLIDDLLAFSRMGRAALDRSWVDMAALTRVVFDDLRRQEGITPTLEVEEVDPAWGDATLLRQVLFNLLSNAFKFTRPVPTPAIWVSGRRENGESVYSVRDNGVGFDMSYAGKLFGVFQRLHSVEEFDGTGVGLAIVARVIERHGGRVWAQGGVGQGATFSFSLPDEAKT